MREAGLRRFYYFILYYFSFFYVFYVIGFGSTTVISAFKEILIIALVFCIWYRGNDRLLVKKKSFVFFVIYGLILLYAALNASSLGYIYVDLKYYLIWPLIIVAGSNLFTTYKDLKGLINHITIISFIIGIIGLYGYLTVNMDLTQWRTSFQIYAPKSVLSTAFDFGALMAIAAYLNLIAFLRERKGSGGLARLILVAFFTVMTFLSYIRGDYLLLILLIYLALRGHIARNRSFRTRLASRTLFDIFVIILCIVVFVVMSGNELLSTESLVMRLTEVWPSMSVQNILLGGGFGIVGRSAYGVSSYSVSDNSFLRTILTIGVLGLAMLVIAVVNFYRKSMCKSHMLGLIIPVAVTAFFSDFIVFTPAMFIVYTLLGCFSNITDLEETEYGFITEEFQSMDGEPLEKDRNSGVQPYESLNQR